MFLQLVADPHLAVRRIIYGVLHHRRLRAFIYTVAKVRATTIGAILLSLYLGFKVIWIDKDDPHESKVTVAFLHDRVAGHVLPMTGGLFASDPPELMHGYWGLREIARYPFYTKLKGNPSWNKLKATKGDNSNPSHRAVEQLIEYAVLDWLAQRAPAYDLILLNHN